MFIEDIEVITQDGETVFGTPLNQVKKSGETFFKRTPDARQVFIINHYNHSDKTYTCENYLTGAEVYIKANKMVYVGFAW